MKLLKTFTLAAAIWSSVYASPGLKMKRQCTCVKAVTGSSKPFKFRNYTALGDSFSAGLGASQRLGVCLGNDSTSYVCTTEECGKDTGAYPYLFAKNHNLLNGNFRYDPCSGYNTTNILTQVNSADFGNPDLITLTAGGDDDKSFAKVVVACITDLVMQYNETICKSALDAANDTINNPSGTPRRLDKLFSAINTRSPNATVLVMGYPKFYGSNYSVQCGDLLDDPSPIARVRMNELVGNLNDKLKSVSDVYNNFRYVSVDEEFEGHRFCDQPNSTVSQTWLQNAPRLGFDTYGKFYVEKDSVAHPKSEGQMAYLNALEKVVGSL